MDIHPGLRILRPCRGAVKMVVCRFHDFSVTIDRSPQDEPPYPVTARYRGQVAKGTFPEDALLPEWQDLLRAMGNPIRPPGHPTLAQAGGRLFQALFQDDVRELWAQAEGERHRPDGPDLRLRLVLNAPGAAALPWELLYDPRRRHPLAADARYAFVRTENLAVYVERPRDLSITWPLTLLVAAPEDPHGIIRAGQEVETIQGWLGHLPQERYRLEILTGRFDVHELRRRMEELQPHILHLMAHGAPDGLLLWQEDQPTFFSSVQIQALIRPIESLRLVFLNACLAGQPDRSRPFSSLAQHLLQTGLPGLVAMQFEIREDAALRFAAFAYEALVQGRCPGHVDVAVSEARNYLFIDSSDHVDYATPILWLQTESGLLFPRAVPERREAPPPVVDPKIPEKERWLQRLPHWNRDTLSPQLRLVYDSRQLNVHEAHRLLEQLKRLAQEQARGQVRAGALQQVLEAFEAQQREIERLTQILQERAGPPAS